jgi:uncharacterized membrane protein (UPF0127 family)
MGVRRIPRGAGMLFAFADGARGRIFWMKGTRVPLDIVFLDGSGRVTSVAARVPATPRTPDAEVARRFGIGAYVIELGAGDAARAGLVPGVRIALRARELKRF